jgi:carbamate kinase
VRVVVALGGNALLRRGEPLTSDVQRENVRVAARALAPVALANELVLSHGNGPQVGLLAMQSSALAAVDPYPLDVLGAETEGMIGYLIEQELGNVLPPQQPLATILTMVEVDPADPAFASPTKFIGPGFGREESERLAGEHGWAVALDGERWRRVVPSPAPQRIFEIRPIRWLLERGVVVICAGGGGIPTVFQPDGSLVGAEVVIDKDLASGLLARELGADLFVMATDVAGVFLAYGSPEAVMLRETTPAHLRTLVFPAGSMGPKVEAACRFVEQTGCRAAIGSLGCITEVVSGDAGTQVLPA